MFLTVVGDFGRVKEFRSISGELGDEILRIRSDIVKLDWQFDSSEETIVKDVKVGGAI